jgi:hypothetical protein
MSKEIITRFCADYILSHPKLVNTLLERAIDAELKGDHPSRAVEYRLEDMISEMFGLCNLEEIADLIVSAHQDYILEEVRFYKDGEYDPKKDYMEQETRELMRGNL